MQPTAAQTGAPGAAPSNIFGSLLPGSGVSPQLYPVAMEALTGMFDPYLMSGYAQPAAQAMQGVQKAQTAEAALKGLLPEFQAAGGGQGPVGGLLSRLGSMFTGGEAARYGGQAQQAAQAISAATGIPVGEVSAYLPQITQSPETAQLNIQQLQNLLGSLGAGSPVAGLSTL